MTSMCFFKLFYALLLLVLYDAGSILGNNWPSKTNEAKCIEKERQALLSFQRGLRDNWGMLSTWRDDQNNGDCCKWEGIQCNNETGHVFKLDLRAWGDRDLSSRTNIPSLIDLQNLEYLDLNSNSFFPGHIPELIGSFSKLRYLDLSYSNFVGSIPYQLGNMSRLRYLDIRGNLLVGAIPHQLGKLTQLRYLDLGYNTLDGGIPYEFVNLGHLQYLDLGGENYLDDLGDNYLSGAIPFQNGSLPKLHTLRLRGEFDLKTKDAEWLSSLSSLINLDLSSLDLGYSHYWLHMINKCVPTLRDLRLTNCSLLDNDVRSLFDSHSNFSSSITILDLSYNMLTSSTLQLLSKHSNNLQELYVSYNNIVLLSPPYPNFTSLVILDISHNNLASSIFHGNFNFSSKLEVLNLQNCSLMDRSFIVPCISTMNSSSSLVDLDLSNNLLMSSAIFNWLFKFATNLQTLHLKNNLLEGPTPDDFGKMNSLEDLDLSVNELKGQIPTSFGNICTLQTLCLNQNNLSGDISSFFQNSSWCNRHVLYNLDLSSNWITGMLPKSNGLLSKLENLYLEWNSLEGNITELHLSTFSKLSSLDLSYNALSLKFVPSWVPPFQLTSLALGSCKLGPNFPSWLQTQNHLEHLDISDAGINGFVPEWFWNNMQSIDNVLDMSHNNFIGGIPNLPVKLVDRASIVLNSNHFEGAVPPFLLRASSLFLHENKFSNLLHFCNSRIASNLGTLVLANNQIKGQLPDCWGFANSLLFLDLSNNDLSGKIPPSMGTLARLKALVLRNNTLVGELPSTLKNCTNLVMLDVGENLLSGSIPSWMGQRMQQLIILSISGNHFSGNIPMHLCYLRKIQLLDLSRNNLSNKIPTCLKNFTAMSTKSINSSDNLNRIYWHDDSSIDTMYSYYGYYAYLYYRLNTMLMWKGVESGFKDPELLLNSIDLSSNHLTGKIPKELGYLVGLVSLNLSINNLSGIIPLEIGNLTSLDFLDMSRNHLTGRIPPTLSQIDRLGVLNLSYNSLSGRIPFGRQLQTFGASSFEGNLDLCGEQLNKSCPEDMTPVKPQEPTAHDKDNNSSFYEALYMSMGLGFFTGFWGFLGPILFWRPWRSAYLKFLNKMTDYIYVMVAVNMAKCSRLLKN